MFALGVCLIFFVVVGSFFFFFFCKNFLGVDLHFNFFGIKTLCTLNTCSSSYTALDDHRQKTILSSGLITVDGDLDDLGGLVMSDVSTLKLLYPPIQCCL